MDKDAKKNGGYTLIELMVTAAVSVILMAGVYAAYRMHNRTHITQRGSVDLLQSMRSALAVMEREIRMAGYDPNDGAGAGIAVAGVGELAFTMDLNDDGERNPLPATDPNERIRYALTNDANGDGLADGMPCSLGREIWWNGLQPMVQNVEALNFVYWDGSDPPQRLTPPIANPNSIRVIEVTMVARSEEKLPVSAIRYKDNRNYLNQQNEIVRPAPNDDYRRLRMTAEIMCRNLAFEPF